MSQEVMQRLKEYYRLNPDATPIEALGALDLDPRWQGAAEAIANGYDGDEVPDAVDVSTVEETESDSEPIDADEPIDKPGSVVEAWRDVEFRAPNAGVWPAELLDREQWMGHADKKPFAPWGDKNAPAPCSKDGHTDASECDCDARFKWGYEEQYVDGDTIAIGEEDHRLDGRVFLQTDDDPYAFVDGDDVRDPETGTVHPRFIEILEELGISYADISTSGAGVHVYYKGELPNDIPQASWPIDDEPWGSNDDEPAIEIYANKHVCVATGEHVPGSGLDVNEWDDDALESILDDAGQLRQTATTRSNIDLEGYEPDKTDATETTTDIRDQFYAINRLDARKVAEETIVSKWNDNASTSAGARAFWPTWGSSNDSGTANYVDDKIWNDTGHNGGYGGPLVMALIDAGEISNVGASPQDASGSAYFTAVEHLRDIGFDIPKLDDDEPELDILNDDVGDTRDIIAAEEAAAVAGAAEPTDEASTAETDGGAAVADNTNGLPPYMRSFDDRVRAAIQASQNDEIKVKTARHRIARALIDEFDFVYPEEGVSEWRNVLYVYDPAEGVYEPRGEYFAKQELEKAGGDFVTNQTANEIVEKVKRMTISRGRYFDVDPNRLVVGNGILDLHTGELTSYTPTEYHRTKIDVNWNPDAGEPDAIDNFLHDIVKDSDVNTLYRLIAHTLYKEYIDEKAAILIGGGQNGKSVFLDFVKEFIGSYNVTHRELQDFDDDGFAANNLQGKMANLATEIGEQKLENTTTFKKLTGRDTLDARVKFEKPITFENYATLMFATNEMPVFGQDNHAIWRRWVYVDFPYTFDADDPEAKDPEPKRVLMRRLTDDRQLEALLLRCQQEIQRWYEGEPFFADAMDPDEVREKMKKAAEPVYAFAASCLSVGDSEDTFVEKSVVRAAYRAYAEAEDLPKMPENRFGEELVALRDFTIEPGQRRVDGTRTHVYNGIELSSRGRQVMGLDAPDDGQGQIDDRPQATRIVMTEIRSMVEENDGQAVPTNGVVWRCSGQIGKIGAQNALNELAKRGEVMVDGDDNVLPTDV